MPTFWNSLTPPWQACLEEAWASFCAGGKPIGATVTAPDGRILTRGRNRFRAADGPAGQAFGSVLAHAELNALLQLNCPASVANAFALYTTLEPCPLCMGAIYMSGVGELHYAARDAYAGSVDILGSTPYLSRKPVRALGPERPDLETLMIAIHAADTFQEGRDPSDPVMHAWQAALPDAIRLAQRLHETGFLHSLRVAGVSPEEAFYDLETFYVREAHDPR